MVQKDSWLSILHVCPMIPRILPCQRNLSNSCDIVRVKMSIQSQGATPMHITLVWFTDGSRMKEGTRARVYGQSVGTRLSISLGRYATVFQAEIFAILACAHEIQFQGRPEKHVFAPTARQP